MNYPIIFDKFTTDFTTHGLAILENAKNIKIKKVVNGEYTLSFLLPRNDSKWQYVLEENFIQVDSQLFRIRTFDEQRDSTGKVTSNIQCEHVWYDANDCAYFPSFEMIGSTPTQILEAAFSGTRFTIGTVDASLANTDIFLSKTNPAAIVNKLIENVGGELERDNYTISLRAKIGNNNGVQFRTGKNNASIKKTTDSKGLTTRLYPYGVEDMDISSVNPTAYLDSSLINNYDYIHTGYKDYKEISDPAELKAKGQAEFSTSDKDGIDKPKITYEVSVIELKKLANRPFETFTLGDTVRIIDEDLNIDVNARIMEYEYYPYEPQRSSVTLANFKSNIGKFLANLSETRHQVNNMTTPTGKVKAAWLENIIERLQTEIQAGLTKKVVSHDYGDMWVDNIENPTKALAIVNGMFAIANSKKENGDWDWKQFGNGDGFTASLINAGVIRLADNLTVENADGTTKLTTAGLEVVNTGTARVIVSKTQIAMQVWNTATGAWVNGIYFDTSTKKYVFDGTLSTTVLNAISANIGTLVSTTIIVQNLYAAKGTIADLTVSEIDTSQKVEKFLAGNKNDDDYWKGSLQHLKFVNAHYIGDLVNQTWTTYPDSPELTADYPFQVIYDAGGSIRLICSADKWYYYFGGDNQLKSATTGKMYQYNGSTWVYVSTATNFSYTTILQSNYDVYTNDTLANVMFTATTTAAQYEQLTDRNGDDVYWVDGTRAGTTKEVTAYPVNVYKYDELVKLEISFKDIDGVQTPIITWGAGAGVEGHPTWGQALDYKVSDGIIRKYIKEATGEEVIFKIGENGLEGYGVGTIYHDRVATAKTINTVESVVLSKDILFPYMSKTEIKVTITGTVSAPCNITAKTYVDGNALNLQPVLPCSGNFTLSYSDLAQYIPSGTKTIEIKLSTDTADGTVAIGQGIMTIQTFADSLPTFYNVTLFTSTPISATEIDLGWTNPVSGYFTEVEVYRSTTDISAMSRADCVTNGSLIYTGTLEVYSDTGLTAGTQYYYKIFAKYTVEGTTYYSTGTADSETTLVAPPILQSAATNTAGTVITLTFDKAMANPSGKHAQFSATVAGVARGITAAALNADTSKIDLTLASAVTSGQVVTIDYTAGDVAASDTSPLESFSGQSVTNNVVAPYQSWSGGYPSSPELTSVYPYQCIVDILYQSIHYYNLYVSPSIILKQGNTLVAVSGNMIEHNYSGGVWKNGVVTPSKPLESFTSTTFLQANNNVYTDPTLTTVYFAKTTP